ncbi:MAG: dTDP-4-dehydrorhamnose 3,5-epimerase [Flavobacteriales bacterium]|nr:dTDP-4-dehydrorhamnose 3,5-epimerase [Flavobacteriales bacterium]|tara:strand:+ start:25183 stop:25737 length:555 start_codon:yes stop_codon:yes gene_type:complete
MKKIKTKINDLFIIENNFHSDNRGWFKELWNKDKEQENKINIAFSQDNLSVSKINVIRGLHFQKHPYGQIKYVSVLSGKVLDVVVDLRRNSKTFGQYFSLELSGSNHLGLLIPNGFAHGFLSLQENTIFYYKCFGKYSPEYEYTLKWNDTDINIKWGINKPILSEKDKNGITLNQYIKSNSINA